MNCPKGHGPMQLVEDRTMFKQYLCTDKSCNVRLKLNTETGEVAQVVAGVAAIGAAALGLLAALFGGS